MSESRADQELTGRVLSTTPPAFVVVWYQIPLRLVSLIDTIVYATVNLVSKDFGC